MSTQLPRLPLIIGIAAALLLARGVLQIYAHRKKSQKLIVKRTSGKIHYPKAGIGKYVQINGLKLSPFAQVDDPAARQARYTVYYVDGINHILSVENMR